MTTCNIRITIGTRVRTNSIVWLQLSSFRSNFDFVLNIIKEVYTPLSEMSRKNCVKCGFFCYSYIVRIAQNIKNIPVREIRVPTKKPSVPSMAPTPANVVNSPRENLIIILLPFNFALCIFINAPFLIPFKLYFGFLIVCFNNYIVLP